MAQVENLVVGAPCGVMDQMASSLGDEGALMAMSCQPAEVEPEVCNNLIPVERLLPPFPPPSAQSTVTHPVNS